MCRRSWRLLGLKDLEKQYGLKLKQAQKEHTDLKAPDDKLATWKQRLNTVRKRQEEIDQKHAEIARIRSEGGDRRCERFLPRKGEGARGAGEAVH